MNDEEVYNLRLSVTELAESVKELVRVTQCFPNYDKLPDTVQRRFDALYRKASAAKNRIDIK